MRSRLLVFFVLLFSVSQVCCSNPITTTQVTVVDEYGEPISGVEVGITHTFRFVEENLTEEGTTDKDGVFRFTGPSQNKYFIGADKDGYYESKQQGTVYLIKDREAVYEDRDIRLLLKKVKNPIPLHARARVSLKVPEYGREFGFDCEAADWVAPFGRGQNADLFFKVDGYYNERDDRDTTLTMSFPNVGDGLISFSGSAKQGSQLISAHEAPEDGYRVEKIWRKARIPTEEANDAGLRFTSYDDYREGLNYYLRVQTILDPDGDVVSAKYAKIYGDLKFDGVWNRESYIIIDALYFNPTTNERNLEYKVGENLNAGLRSTEEPVYP